MIEDCNTFSCFRPLVDKVDYIPNLAGNYIICLNEGSDVPEIGIDLHFQLYAGLRVLYVGVSKRSLRNRDFKQHFNGNNAGRSTLRKSLGSLFGYTKIARDKKPNGKTKFNATDEEKLSNWMLNNLTLFYESNSEPLVVEDKMIIELNPPLNLSKNRNEVNRGFRKKLKELRNI